MSTTNDYITRLVIRRVEKWLKPSKHHVYVIHVTWTVGGLAIIFRRYQEFFDFQVNLLTIFPKEAGEENDCERIIPMLPGKVFFGNRRKSTVEERTELLKAYCEKLITLPTHISRSDDVLNFLSSNEEDLRACIYSEASTTTASTISDPTSLERYMVQTEFKKTNKGEISASKGQLIEVVEKTDTGWWWVRYNTELGWFPAAYMRPIERTKRAMTRSSEDLQDSCVFICIKKFTREGPHELSLRKGCLYKVVNPKDDGWWLVESFNGAKGEAPGSHLRRLKTSLTPPSAISTQRPTRPIPGSPKPPRPPPPSPTTQKRSSSMSDLLAISKPSSVRPLLPPRPAISDVQSNSVPKVTHIPPQIILPTEPTPSPWRPSKIKAAHKSGPSITLSNGDDKKPPGTPPSKPKITLPKPTRSPSPMGNKGGSCVLPPASPVSDAKGVTASKQASIPKKDMYGQGVDSGSNDLTNRVARLKMMFDSN